MNQNSVLTSIKKSDTHKLFVMVPQIASSIISNKDVQQRQNILQVNSEF